MPRGIKAKPVENTAAEAMEDVVSKNTATKENIEALIVKLCDDVTNGRTRDEFKTLEAIANLYNAVK